MQSQPTNTTSRITSGLLILLLSVLFVQAVLSMRLSLLRRKLLPRVQLPVPGYYAISAHILVRLKLEILKRGGGRDWLKDFTPVDVIGNSIYIFKF